MGVFENLTLSRVRSDVIRELGLVADGYFLITLHRQENVDNKKRFKGILEGLGLIHESVGLSLVFPIHPRTEKMIKSFGFKNKRFPDN